MYRRSMGRIIPVILWALPHQASTTNSVHPRASGDPDDAEASASRPGSPLARGRTELGYTIFTYSKSPGLLSMPTFGGAIQPANFAGSVSGLIRVSGRRAC